MINLTAQLDTAEINRKMREVYANAKQMTSGVVTESEKMDIAMMRFKNTLISTAAQIGGGIGLFQLAKQIATTRGEFQQLEVAFKTLLQSEDKAKVLMSEMVTLAAKTPFDLQGVANGARQLLAYGFSAGEVTNTLTRLGNVAAGLGLPLERLTYLYGTTSVQGRLYARDMLQFTSSGIPLLQSLADMYGKSTEEINAMVSAGKIGFEDVKKVIEQMTNSGGKFYNLMQEQSKTINGQISNLGDSISKMFNEIGQSQEGAISGAISGAAYLVENYDKVLKILVPLVAAYGVYKASLIAVAAAQKVQISMELAQRYFSLAKAISSATKAQVMLNLAMRDNPLGLFLGLITGIVSALVLFGKRADDANRVIGEQEQAVLNEGKQVNMLIMKLTDANTKEKERKEALEQLKSIQPNIVEGINAEAGATKQLTDNLIAYNEEYIGKIVLSQKGDAVAAAIEKRDKAGTAALNAKIEAQRKLGSILAKAQDGDFKITPASGDVRKATEEDIKGYTALLTKIMSGGGALRNKLSDVMTATSRTTLLDGEISQIRISIIDLQREAIDAEIAVNSANSDMTDAAKRLGQAISDSVKATTDRASTEITNSIDVQLKNARTEFATFEKELSDLMSGKLPEGSGKDFDFAKAIEEKQKQLKDAENKINTLTGIDPKAAKSAATAAEKLQEQYQDDRLASLKDAKAAELDLERNAIEDKIKLIEFERDARINAIKEEKEAYQKKHGENADTSGFDRQIVAVKQQADADIQEQVQEDTKAQLVAMQEYLKEYGAFQQKKYAVTEEYARKIKEAQTEGGRLSLEKELASYNSNSQAQYLKMNIDWGTVFGEFGGMFSDMIKPALEEAKKYLSTDQFKKSDEASKQALIEAIAQMEKSLGGSGTLNFKKLGTDMQAYQNSLIALNQAKQEEVEAINKLKGAQQEYEKALKNSSQTEIDTTKTNLENAQDNATAASENVQTQIGIANQTQVIVTDTATALKGSMDNVTQGLSKLASGSLVGAYEGLLQASKGVGGIMEKFADRLENVPIIGWIVSIIDLFKDGLSLLVGGLLDAIFNAISGIIGDILSGDIFVTIAESISKGIFNIIKSIVTLGGVFGFMDNDSDPDLQADVDKLTASNERLKEALNRLADKMDDAATSEATSVYKEQLDNVKSREQNTQEMMSREAGAWTNWGYGFAGMGGRSSSNRSIDDNISGSEWSEISKIVGRNISNAGDFWGLSSEEMAKVADEAGWIYDKIKGYADDGHKDAAQYMDAYIAYAKEREELEKAYYEKLTSTSFDSVRDEFKNTLMDMEADAEDFATNFEKMMQNAIIESMMTENYDKKLMEWYRSFGDAMEDGDITQAERDALQSDYNNMVNDALKERDALKDIFGWNDETESSREASKGFNAMSQDTGNELNGRFTVMTDIMHKSMIVQEHIREMGLNIADATFNIRDLVSVANNHLAAIRNNTNYLQSINGQLKKIEENTAYLK